MLISDFPIYNAPNYAPVEPLLKLEETTSPKQEAFHSQVKALYEELNSRDEPIITAASEVAFTIASFIQGKQIWQRNWHRGGSWEPVVPDKNTNPNLTRSFNKMQFQVSQMIEDIISSNPDFEPNDMFKSYEHEKVVKASKAVWNHYESKFYGGKDGAWFNNQQAHSLITTGMAIEELVYDADKKSIDVLKEIWGTRTVPINEGGGECFNCGMQGKYEDFHQWENPNDEKEFNDGMQEAPEQMAQERPLAFLPQCPECGSFETDVEEPEHDDLPSVIGLERYSLGDFRLANLEMQRTRFDVSGRPEDSTYFIDKQYIPLRKLRMILGRDIKIGEGGTDDRGLELLHKMSRIGASIGGARHEFGDSAGQRGRSAVLCRMSLSPEELAEIDIPNGGDLRTISGGTLPSGQTGADLCPDGATIVGFNGMEVIYGIYPRCHTRRIASAVYFSKANAGTGRGAEDLTEIQKRWNRIDAQQVAAVEGASPGYAYVEGSVDENHAKKIGHPNIRIPVRREFFNITQSVDGFIKQFDPQQVAPQFFAYTAELEKMMQMTAHNVSMSGSVFDADNKTATGARILEATAQAITIPILQSRAGMRLGTIHNLLGEYKEVFSTVKRKFAVKGGGGKHFSKTEISGDELDENLEFVVVENSMIPQNYYTRKGDYLAFADAMVRIDPLEGYRGLKSHDPELLKIYANAFGVDLGNDEYGDIEELCRLRFLNAVDLMALLDKELDAPPEPPMMQPQQAMAPQTPPAQLSATPPGGGEQGGAMPPEGGQAPPPAPDAMMAPPQGAPPEQGQPPMGMSPSEPINTPENMYYDVVFEMLDIPIRPKEKNHVQKAKWFQDFADSPEGIELPKEVRDLCFEFVVRHEQSEMGAMTADSAQMQLNDIAAKAPAMAIQAKAAQMLGMGEEPSGSKPPSKSSSSSSKSKSV